MATNGFLGQSSAELLESMRQQQMQLQEKRRAQRASNPRTHGASALGNMLGSGAARLFGKPQRPEDSPMYQKAKDIEGIVAQTKQANPDTKEFYTAVANKFAERGYQNEAMQAISKLREMQQQEFENAAKAAEVDVKQRNATTNERKASTSEKGEQRKEKWNSDYLTYLYDALNQRSADRSSGPNAAMANFKVNMWNSKVNELFLKDFKDKKINIDPAEITKMSVEDKMNLISESSRESLQGFVASDGWLERLLSPQLLNGPTAPSKDTKAGSGSPDVFDLGFGND